MDSFASDTYGEITYKGIDVLLETFPEYFNNSEGVFYDLGSGNGDLSIYIASKTPLKKVCGIELHTERCNESKEKSKDLKLNQLSFIESNFLDVDLSDATIVYFANEGIPKIICHKIWDKLPKGCLLICGRRIKNSETRKKYKWTEPIEKKCISNEKWIYFSKSQKYIIKEE